MRGMWICVNYTGRMQGLWPKIKESQVAVDVAPNPKELRVQGFALIVKITS
jgi:hypothetical protein